MTQNSQAPMIDFSVLTMTNLSVVFVSTKLILLCDIFLNEG